LVFFGIFFITGNVLIKNLRDYMRCRIILCICSIPILTEAKQSLDAILAQKQTVERAMDKLAQEKRTLEDYSYKRLGVCEESISNERTKRVHDRQKCKLLVDDLKKKEKLLKGAVNKIEKERDQSREVLSQSAMRERDLYAKIADLQEQIQKEHALSQQLADEKMKLEMVQVELRTLVNELQDRLQGKNLTEQVLKKQLDKIK